ncbi:MAG: CRISPR-associated endonuclease Cas3'' [Candidatus Latescibacterota bacterium]
MPAEPFYARTREGASDPQSWQLLVDHLRGVAALAGRFAAAFGSAVWGELAGLWHDLGKFRPEFQARLRGARIAAEHSGTGAALACAADPSAGAPLALAIAGHHAGLANLRSGEAGGNRPLRDRVRDNASLLGSLRPVIPPEIGTLPLPELPAFLHSAPARPCDPQDLMRRREFWVRFLFSALVDADRLDAEAFDDPRQAAQRGSQTSIAELRSRLDRFVEAKVSRLDPGAARSPVNRARAEVLAACRQAAEWPPGCFSLTVPTGGGKTLSAMAFALRHAEHHGLRRVFVVIPYTSIIEQNAAVYRDALGVRDVLEHHSNLDPERLRRDTDEETCRRADLASENWDAPVVVTTTVQFFESLFSHLPGRCRRLHNVAQSVILLDEVQALPPEFLVPVLDGLRQLVSSYGCSVVLATATPPALAVRETLPDGLPDVRPVIGDPASLGRRLRRVTYEWPSPATAEKPDEAGVLAAWESLAQELAGHPRVLAVVHRRDDARTLARLLSHQSGQEVVHLSALMCPAHRSAVLERVREALAAGAGCRAVSTQLVEAGVDLDFPVVYRALGGLDSIVQAAGRCNREGRLPAPGRVVVFQAPTRPPPGTPRRALEATLVLLRQAAKEGGPDGIDVEDPAVFERYFRILYGAQTLDARHIQRERAQLNFETVGTSFQLIEDRFSRSVVVPWDEAEERLDALRHQGPNRSTLRALQPYTVSAHVSAFERLLQQGALEEVVAGLWAIPSVCRHLYDAVFGLVVGDAPIDPESLIA